MSRSAPTVAAAALLAAAALSAPATASAQDRLGFYFDAAGAATTTTTSAPGELVPGWLILADPSHTDGIGSWQGRIQVVDADDAPVPVIWTLAGGANNYATPPSFDVGTFTPLPWAPQVVLATAFITVASPDQQVDVFILSPQNPTEQSPSGYPVYRPLYGHGPDYVPAIMGPADVPSTGSVAAINGPPRAGDANVNIPAFWLEQPMAAGYTYNGRLNLTRAAPSRDLDLLVEPLGGLRIGRLRDTNSPDSDLRPFVDQPVWSRFRAGSSGYDYFEMRYTTQAAGMETVSVRLTRGDVVTEQALVFEVLDHPCLETGETEAWRYYKMEDQILSFPPVLPDGPFERTGYVTVQYIGKGDFVVAPRLDGAPAFRIVDDTPDTLSENHKVHRYDLVFAPHAYGSHEAVLELRRRCVRGGHPAGVGAGRRGRGRRAGDDAVASQLSEPGQPGDDRGVHPGPGGARAAGRLLPGRAAGEGAGGRGSVRRPRAADLGRPRRRRARGGQRRLSGDAGGRRRARRAAGHAAQVTVGGRRRAASRSLAVSRSVSTEGDATGTRIGASSATIVRNVAPGGADRIAARAVMGSSTGWPPRPACSGTTAQAPPAAAKAATRARIVPGSTKGQSTGSTANPSRSAGRVRAPACTERNMSSR